jgi:hypothetical protein
MKLFEFDEDEIVPNRDYTAGYYVNLECVAYLEAIHYKSNPDGLLPDLWHVYFGDHCAPLSVTEAGFERLKRAMTESQ